jgi:hypothetical protein
MSQRVAAGVGIPVLSAVAATKSVQLADLRSELPACHAGQSAPIVSWPYAMSDRFLGAPVVDWVMQGQEPSQCQIRF